MIQVQIFLFIVLAYFVKDPSQNRYIFDLYHDKVSFTFQKYLDFVISFMEIFLLVH